jgi:hypothetical protein
MLAFRRTVFRDALVSGWPAWLACAGIVVAVALGTVCVAEPEARVRYAGTVLQVGGLLTVAWGLRDMRRLFKRPSLGSAAATWLHHLLSAFGRPKPAVVGASAVALAWATLDARAVVGPGPDATIPERLAAVEARIKELQLELGESSNKLSNQIAAVSRDVQAERQQRETAGEQATRSLEAVAVGGLHLEVVGLTWLISGVICTSIPSELAAWLGVG